MERQSQEHTEIVAWRQTGTQTVDRQRILQERSTVTQETVHRERRGQTHTQRTRKRQEAMTQRQGQGERGQRQRRDPGDHRSHRVQRLRERQTPRIKGRHQDPEQGKVPGRDSTVGKRSRRTALHRPTPPPRAHTNLEVGVSSQGFIDQSVPLWVPWTQVHDVTLSLLVCQGY